MRDLKVTENGNREKRYNEMLTKIDLHKLGVKLFRPTNPKLGGGSVQIFHYKYLSILLRLNGVSPCYMVPGKKVIYLEDLGTRANDAFMDAFKLSTSRIAGCA